MLVRIERIASIKEKISQNKKKTPHEIEYFKTVLTSAKHITKRNKYTGFNLNRIKTVLSEK